MTDVRAGFADLERPNRQRAASDEGRLRTIAVATDFSPNAMAAFAWALELARRHRSELVLVHALLPDASPTPDSAPMPEQYDRGVRDDARARLEALMAEVRPAGLPISVELVVGSTAPGILATAEQRRADLLVVGTRALTGWKRVVGGGTATRVVREASLPVLTVHAGDARRSHVAQTVLVPTDFSSDARCAAETALRVLASAESGRLVLLHAHRRPAASAARQAAAEAVAAAAAAARESVVTLARSRALDDVVVEAEVAEGAPAQVIVEHAARLGADLVAMGTRGRSGLERWWLGSTAERVIASAPCPVLTVRAARS